MTRRGYTEEVQAQYIAAMGPELGELFCAISAELTWTRVRWSQFRILFGEKPSRIDLLNKAAPMFFGILRDTLFSDTVLAIARMVDPIESGKGRGNLTIQRFPSLITDPNLKDEVIKLIEYAKETTAFARDRRNRNLAHLDFDLYLSNNPRSLTPASRKAIEDSLSAIAAVLNSIQIKCCGAETAYEFCSTVPGDALSLLRVIQDGIKFEHDRQARRARGDWSEAIEDI